MLLKIVLVCLAAGAYAVNGYGRPDLSDLDDFDVPVTPTTQEFPTGTGTLTTPSDVDDFDGPVTPTTPAAPTGTGTPNTPSTPTSTVPPVTPVSPARPVAPVGTLPPVVPVVRPAAVPFAPATRPAIFTPGAAGFGPSGLPGEEWKPYSFGYDITDEFGTRLFHNEQSDNKNAKTGTYGYRNANGLFRTVSYVADADGYRATIDTNEPGTARGASADAVFNANPVAAPSIAPQPGGYTRTGPAFTSPAFTRPAFTRPAFTRPSYTQPAVPFNVRGPGGYMGSYAGGLRGPYGGGSGVRYGSGFGSGHSAGYGSGYSGGRGSGYGGGYMGGYAGANTVVYPGRYRAGFGRGNSGAYQGTASPGSGYKANYGAVGYRAGQGARYGGAGYGAGYTAGYTGAHHRGSFGAVNSGGYASRSLSSWTKWAS